MDSVVGDLAHNAHVILLQAVAAAKNGAQIAVTPELSLVGYPPRDLLLRSGFTHASADAANLLAKQLAQDGAGDLAVIVGLPWHVDNHSLPISNACAVLRGGKIECVYTKRLLPHYDVFDEARYFAHGSEPIVIDVAGEKVGILICEDFWKGADVGESGGYQIDPLTQTVQAGAKVIVVPSASPFFLGKQSRRIDLIARAAASHKVSIASVNAVGANDDFVFDGGSCILHPDGTGSFAKRFGEEVLVVDCAATSAQPANMPSDEELAHAMTSAIRGYVRKTGHHGVLLGLSGGIDSALVAALAVAALGPKNVRGISMPGPFSSEESRTDAMDSAKRLGMNPPDVLSINDAYRLMGANISLAAEVAGITDENLQSRLRGLTLMTLSNATGALVLSTGNKSEFAVGYATLYGDMCGGMAPLGDLLKTQVFSVARWLNANPSALGFLKPPIPQSSLTKPPSAELRPNQTDQDSLPEYSVLDQIVSGWVDDEKSAEEIAQTPGLDRALVARWTAAIDRAQYKRNQAPIIPKLSARAFGPGRRMPLAMRCRLVDDSSAV